MIAMRNYLKYITYILAAAFMCSCVKIDIHPVEQSPAGDLTSVTLQLKSSDLVATRVSGDDDDPNEYSINHIQCFFSVNDNDGIDNNTIVYATDIITIPANQAEAQSGTVTDLEITIPSDKMTPLFSDGNCSVYVVANGPADGIDVTEGTTTIAGVKATAVSLEQYETSGEGENMISQAAAQTSFVMDGDAVVSKATDKISGIVKISGTVPLYRVAAKILVKLNVSNKIVYDNGTESTDDDVEWTPLLEKIKINYINSVIDSKLNAESSSANLETLSNYLQEPYEGYVVYGTESSGETTICTQNIPFYTYPYAWSSNPPSISLIIPWKSKDNITKTFEYQIPINPTKTEKGTITETKSLVRNTVYEMTVNVGILGGLTGKVELSPSYIVTDWGTGTIDAELSRPKYLVVDETKVVMNNVETYSVKYEASDLVGFHVIENSIKEFTYSVNNRKVTVGSGTTAVYGDYVAKLEEIEEGDKKIKYFTFSHELDNSRGPIEECDNQENYDEYDYLANEVVVRIFLKTEENTTYQTAEIYEDITFTQYPAMYIDPVLSSGNVIINSNKSNSVGSVWWYNYGGFLSGKNHYVVNVSAFDETTKDYQICDPRVSSNPDTFIFHEVNYNTDTDGNVRNSTDVTGANLIGYRGTVEGSASRYLVAPSFMIASSAGAYNNTETLSAKCLQYRCAAYQEDGYPAGRWRLPTPAELEVVGKLCSEGKMESIFYDGLTYASSDGLYLYSDSGTFTKSDNKLSKSVRCVYDIWYWDDVCQDKSQFLWGAEGNIAALKDSQNYDSFFKSVE